MSDPSKDFAVRPMTVAHVDRVIEIAKDLPDAPHWPPNLYLAALNPGSSPRRIALVASVAEGEPVLGFVVASLIPPQAELESIAVATHSQRRGLGRFLFQALATRLRAAGVSRLLLEVRVSNLSAIAFYRCLGFASTGRRPGYYTDPVEDAMLLSLDLT